MRFDKVYFHHLETYFTISAFLMLKLPHTGKHELANCLEDYTNMRIFLSHKKGNISKL